MLIRRLLAYKNESPLGLRLLVCILCVSILAGFAATVAQLVFNYRQEVSEIDQRVDEFIKTNGKSLANSMWDFNRFQIESQLNGLTTLADMKYARITDRNGRNYVEVGADPGALAGKKHQLRLEYVNAGEKPQYLGDLVIIPSLGGAYSRVADYALVILAVQLARSIFVSTCILIIVNLMVSRPLTLLAKQVRGRRMDNLSESLQIVRPRWAGQDDEINILVRVLNGMRADLHREISVLAASREALRQSEAKNLALLETTKAVPWVACATRHMFLYIGPQCESVFGIESHQWLQPEFLRDNLCDEDYLRLVNIWSQSNTREFELELHFHSLSGMEQWVLMQGSCSSLTTWQGYLINIDARKQTEIELQHYRNNLERLVEERTVQLRQQNEMLVKVNEQLSATRSQLLLSEKMASIGQLAAGIAHEVNNPMGFISSNLNSLSGYVNDLLLIISQASAFESALPGSAQAELAELKARLDFDFIRTDVGVLLAETAEGVVRVKKIVQGLRDFSRVDSNDDWQSASIVKCIESTLVIAGNEIKYKADVVCNYVDLPPVVCHPSQINQVLLNLFINAAQAIETRGTITINMGCIGERVWIEVADTGGGIPADILPRVFDPFFTTKPVGKGTGLGLSVSYGVVEKHGGKISCSSVVGVGSVFRMELPLSPQPA